jgi:hypothetical protein
VLRRIVPSLLLTLALVGCSGTQSQGESGTECSDGKDNDGDRLIDCDDDDCRGLPICGGRADGRLDLSSRDLPRSPDRVIVPDVRPPDQPLPQSSYGQTCPYVYPIQHCPDGKTYCIPGDTSQTTGYCTQSCAQSNPDSCPPGPGSTVAKCVWGFNGSWYCSFMCRWLNVDYPCPDSSFACVYFQPSQKYCWPK